MSLEDDSRLFPLGGLDHSLVLDITSLLVIVVEKIEAHCLSRPAFPSGINPFSPLPGLTAYDSWQLDGM